MTDYLNTLFDAQMKHDFDVFCFMQLIDLPPND